MMKTIYRFSLLLLILCITGCNDAKVVKEVQEKINVVDQLKKETLTLNTFGINFDSANLEKLNQLEEKFEKNLKIEIITAKKDEVKLKLTKVYMIKILNAMSQYFRKNDFPDPNDVMYEIQKVVNQHMAKKEVKILTFHSVSEINAQRLWLELLHFEDLKRYEELVPLIRLYTPDLLH